jgi:uncharacterized protein YukE
MHLLIALEEDDRTLTASDAADGGDLDDVIDVLTAGAAQGDVLQQQAEAIQQLIAKVDEEVESLKQNWQGDDSRQFEQEWSGTHRPELQRAQKLLTEMKGTIDREVQQQRATSSQY